MKRLFTLVLSLCLAFSLLAPSALAAENGTVRLVYDLTVDGADCAQVRQGDVVTVTFRILRGDGSDESYKVRTLQNEIIYDQSFFEFVEGSAKAVKGGGSALFQTRTDGTHIIKASYLSANGGDYQEEEDFCTFQLKVIASGGTGWITCDWSRAKAYDSEGTAFAVVDGDSSKKSDVTMTANGVCHTFTDVDIRDWYHEAVDYVSMYGLMDGVGGNKFDPDGTMTRAMLVTVLYRLEGSPAVTAKNSFTDVMDGQWYTDAVIWANRNKIVEGYGNGQFGTNDSVTREQIATILYRYAQSKGYDTGKAAGLSAYTDAASISAWALTGMSWANAAGLIPGRTAVTLAPQGTASRAEVATILMRFCENMAG